MAAVDKMINKSLEDIDNILNDIEKSKNVSKAMGNDVPPEEVSEEAPEQEEEGEEEPMEGQEEGDMPDQDDEEGEEPTEEEGTDEDAEKSLESTMNSKDSVRKALEVSEFLQELVSGISTVIDSQRADITKSIESTQNHTMLLAKSFEGIAKAQRAVLENQVQMMKSIDSMNKRIKTIETQPVTRKSVTSTNTKPIEKSFEASLGDTKQGGQELTKSQAIQKLSAEFDKGNTSIIPDILALEGTGSLNSLSPAGKNILGIK